MLQLAWLARPPIGSTNSSSTSQGPLRPAALAHHHHNTLPLCCRASAASRPTSCA